MVDEINRLVKEKTDEGCSVAVIATEETKDAYACAECEECRIARNRGVDSSGIV